MQDARSASCRLRDLLRREHAAMADFLLALADFDRGRGWEDLGYTSCFYFLHRELGLSKSAAFYRSSAAELLQRYPELIEPLRDGRLCLSSVAELAKVITPENRREVVARFFHASAREAKVITAELQPVESPPVRDIVTRPARASAASEPMPQPAALDLPQTVRTSEPEAPARAGAAVAPVPAQPPPPPAPERDQIDPLTADLRRLHTTVSQRFLDKLAAARDALSHAQPDATTEDVLEAALDLLLAKKAARNGLVAKPRSTTPPASSDPRHIPAAVRRAVWERDGGRCQWELDSGGICGATRRLQLDHVIPAARGGPATVENLRLLCDRHNRLAARRHFGEGWMARFAPGPSAPPGARSS